MIGQNESNWATNDTMAEFRRQAKIKLDELKQRQSNMVCETTVINDKMYTESWKRK